MTASERPDCFVALLNLAKGLGVEPVGRDREPQFWDAVQSYPLPILVQATTAVRDTWRSNRFPPPAVIREACDVALAARTERTWTTPGATGLHCETCQDTGWAPHTFLSAKYEPPVELTRVSACACRPTNPVWQAGLAETRQRAATKRNTGRRWDG